MPVMHSAVATKKRKPHRERIASVYRNIYKILPDPQKRNRASEALARIKEIASNKRWQKNLETGAHQYVDEFSKKRKDCVAGLVENEIYIVDEMPVIRRKCGVQEIGACE